jgi:alanine dehydrogenase
VAALLFLSEADVRELLELDALFQALDGALRELSAGRVSVPPRVAAVTPGGLLGAMPGYVPSSGLVAKLVSVFPGNRERGLPSHQGLIALFDDETGEPLAVMDALHITAVRTAATAALAARALARDDARILAILGAGAQGTSHLDAFSRAFDLEEIRVSSTNARHARAVAERSAVARAVESFEEATAGADIVCCCTAAPEPVIRVDWLEPGTHVSSVGTGKEIDASTISSASVFVEWRGAVDNPPPAGAEELQSLDRTDVVEIGEVLAGTHPGRSSNAEITVYKSTGHAVEDAAAARLVYHQAKTRGVGQLLSL